MKIGTLAEATGTPVETIRFTSARGPASAAGTCRQQLPHVPARVEAAGLHPAITATWTWRSTRFVP